MKEPELPGRPFSVLSLSSQPHTDMPHCPGFSCVSAVVWAGGLGGGGKGRHWVVHGWQSLADEFDHTSPSSPFAAFRARGEACKRLHQHSKTTHTAAREGGAACPGVGRKGHLFPPSLGIDSVGFQCPSGSCWPLDQGGPFASGQVVVTSLDFDPECSAGLVSFTRTLNMSCNLPSASISQW